MNFSRWRPHPWHGLSVGPKPPSLVHVYLEITPFDSMKYEVDKQTGYLRVDRPQSGSSLPPCSYGFIPQTYAGDRVGELSKKGRKGDGDPLDVCVISEMPISRAEILLTVRVLGGFCMIDQGAADDKIIGVLENDTVWGKTRSVRELPDRLVERLQHYFSTYKMDPSSRQNSVKLEPIYGVAKARQVIRAAMNDYRAEFAVGNGAEG